MLVELNGRVSSNIGKLITVFVLPKYTASDVINVHRLFQKF